MMYAVFSESLKIIAKANQRWYYATCLSNRVCRRRFSSTPATNFDAPRLLAKPSACNVLGDWRDRVLECFRALEKERDRDRETWRLMDRAKQRYRERERERHTQTHTKKREKTTREKKKINNKEK